MSLGPMNEMDFIDNGSLTQEQIFSDPERKGNFINI